MLNQETLQSQSRINAAAHRLNIASIAKPCVDWLEANDLEVLRVETRSNYDYPRIVIRYSELCDKFDGAVSVFERVKHFERRYRSIYRLGCEVIWSEPATRCAS